MRHAIIAALLGAALLAGCGDDDKAGPVASTATTPAVTATTTDTIRIADFEFEPVSATVRAGEKISIPNADSAPHTVTEEGDTPSFDSGTIKGGRSGSVTFSEPGTFTYLCAFHPTMKGTVTVTR